MRISRLVALFCLCISSLFSNAQDKYDGYFHLLSPEKVYLQTDREVYSIGDTLWFKGYLENAAELSDFKPCNYLYVEIVSSKWEQNVYKRVSEESFSLRKRVKVKRTEDGFVGFIPLTDDLNTGIATIRAYSYWMLNEDPAFMFYKNIELRNPMKDAFVETLLQAEYTY